MGPLLGLTFCIQEPGDPQILEGHIKGIVEVGYRIVRAKAVVINEIRSRDGGRDYFYSKKTEESSSMHGC